MDWLEDKINKFEEKMAKEKQIKDEELARLRAKRENTYEKFNECFESKIGPVLEATREILQRKGYCYEYNSPWNPVTNELVGREVVFRVVADRDIRTFKPSEADRISFVLKKDEPRIKISMALKRRTEQTETTHEIDDITKNLLEEKVREFFGKVFD